MTDIFTDPSTATGDQWKPKTHLGRLVMFEVPQLKPSIGGGKVLGRIGQREAKPGKSGAWFIDQATDADKDLARQWIAAKAQPVSAPTDNPFG